MRIIVKARPGAGKQGIEKITENSYIVSVQEPPIKGKANKAIAKALAEYFGKPVSHVRIALGHASRQKIFEVQD
ncbi:MAG: DUF167 domain-containing protein [bacterium]|nr:DUF167 domain-containing protein [bacterium]